MIILLCLMLSAALSLAETVEERGKRVVNEALTALGGDRFLTMTDRVESGRVYSFYREEIAGLSVAKIYTRYLRRPDNAGPDWIGVEERQTFGRDEYSAILFTGGKGYEITFRGARPLPDAIVERFRLSTLCDVFYILRQRLQKEDLILESRGADIYQGEPIEVVDITDAQNRTVTVYFDASSKLPIREVFYRRDSKTRERIEENVEYGKYRDVGQGVLWPYYILKTRNGERVYQIFSDSVVINLGLKDSLFTLPPDIKILKKQD